MLFVFFSEFLSYVLSFIYRESNTSGENAPFSKCKMYDVNLTTIQSWDYANWNSTKHHEKHEVLGTIFTQKSNGKNNKLIIKHK